MRKGLGLTFKIWKSAEDWDELFPFEGFLEAVEIVFWEVGDLPGNECDHFMC